MLWNGVYPDKYTDNLEKFNETSLSEKKDFYSHLNMENITDADYTHTKRVYKDLKIKKFSRISQFVCSKQHIIVSWCIWKL